MKNKNWIKICLDILMTVLLIMMYNKRVISMNFHEVGGLIVCGLFLIHNGLNFKWIMQVSQRLFDKKLPIKTKVGYVINVLLLIAVTFIGISGVMISKTVLTGISSHNMIWKIGHQVVSAFALVLVGIHVGLHWQFIRGMFKKIVKIPEKISKPLGTYFMIVILAFGTYSMATSSFKQWISMPLVIGTMSGSNEQGNMPGNISKERPDSHGGRAGQESEVEQDESEVKEGKDNRGNKEIPREGRMSSSSVSAGNIINVILTYISILSVFAILTYQIEKLIKKSIKTRRKDTR